MFLPHVCFFSLFFFLLLLFLCGACFVHTLISSWPPLPPRSIYPDEFDNFVERMRVVSNSKSKKFLFEVDVIDPLLNVVLDTNLGADLSRDRYNHSGCSN